MRSLAVVYTYIYWDVCNIISCILVVEEWVVGA